MLAPTLVALLGFATYTAASPTPFALAADDVIVLKLDGTSEVMKAKDFDKLETRAAQAQIKSFATADHAVSKAQIARRGCEKSTEIQILSEDDFLNWDMAISPVIHSTEGTEAQVSVTDGYSISNSLEVSSSMELTLIKDIFSTSLSISYSQQWTTEQSQTLTFPVPEGQYGVIVSQPYVHRVQGNVLSGCTDSPDKATFVSDSYTSQSYGSLSWVKGVIRLCSNETYPIPFCIGEGSHA